MTLDEIATAEPLMDRRTAYRLHLCVDCRAVTAAAGMTRCWPCHSGWSGIRLRGRRARAAAIRAMCGQLRHPGLIALAWTITVVLGID